MSNSRPKTLSECIQHAISIGPLKDVRSRLEDALRDYFAHEAMKFYVKRSHEDQRLIIEFFKHAFRRE